MVSENGMILLAMLLLSVMLGSIESIYAANITKPGCPSKCGNISLPYPYGIGEGCYFNKDFELTCSYTIVGYQQPLLVSTGKRVQEITLDVLYVEHWNLLRCYQAENQTSKNTTFSLDGPYSLSSKANKLTAVGCDFYAYITDVSHNGSRNGTTGCVSLCQDGNDYKTTGACTGFGCCQTTIQSSMKVFEVGMVSINTNSKGWATQDGYCSTAFIEEGLTVDSNIDIYEKGLNYTKRSGLDWVISNGLCEDGTWKNICQENSHCIDNYLGYKCGCSGGYEGNPYLLDGCQDIDECKDFQRCKGGTVCFNIQGGYFCAPPITDDKKFPILFIVCISLGGGLLLLILLAIALWSNRKLKKRRALQLKQKFFKQNGGLLLEQQISSGENNMEKTKIFIIDELVKATDNFNESRVLGRGGSGTVYKGMLPDGRIVAIKKSKIVDETQIGQFINELVILSEINHKNIVKVMGCCLETEVPLLVYEYISRGTLSEHLHGDNQISSMSWEDRLRISKEIAGALSYLHSSITTPIFHRDIKSSNILLDENFKAKVSDFGISRSVPDEQTHLSTVVQGTFGYLDPEYFHSGQFTDKSDVYGFGVVLVELLTGQKAISITRSEDERNLAMHFISCVKEDRVLEVLETRIAKEARKEEIQVVASIAKKCLKLVGKKRPTMKEVVIQLENLRVFQYQESISLLSDD